MDVEDVDVAEAVPTPKSHAHLRWDGVGASVLEKPGEDAPEGSEPKRRSILQDQAGHVAPGQMLAILGPSGGGKTTLLNVLAQRYGREGSSKMERYGQVWVGDECLTSDEAARRAFRQMCGYVTQDSVFFPSLTVEESFTYAAELRIPVEELGPGDLKRRVNELIAMLDLEKCRSTPVGDALNKGISGGEMKRLQVGIELISDPPVLFLDEPTSGLDSATALRLLRLLRKLATEDHRVIVCSIHQPRQSALRTFDQLLLLSRGETLYYGPGVDDLTEHFTRLGYPPSPFENPMDAILDVVNMEGKNEEGEEGGKSRDEIHANLVKGYADLHPEASIMEANAAAAKQSAGLFVLGWRKGNPWLRQFWALLRRSFFYKLRAPEAVVSQFAYAIITMVLVGTIYWQLGLGQKSVSNRMGAMSFLVTMVSFSSYDIVLLFPKERTVYLREHAAGLYDTAAYFHSRGVAELPFHLAFTLITCTGTYFMLGMQLELGRFLVFVLTLELCAVCGASAMMFVGSVSADENVGNVLASILLLMFMLFDGFYVNKETVPVWLRWIEKMSFMGYMVENLALNEFTGLEFEGCDPVTVPGTNGAVTAPPTDCAFPTGEDATAYYGLDDGVGGSVGEKIFYNWVWVSIMIVGYRFLAYLGLRYCYTNQE